MKTAIVSCLITLLGALTVTSDQKPVPGDLVDHYDYSHPTEGTYSTNPPVPSEWLDIHHETSQHRQFACTPPRELERVVIVYGSMKGHGAIVEGGSILTAQHLVEGASSVTWADQQGHTGAATSVWQIGDEDMAVLTGKWPAYDFIPLAKEAPRPGEILFWRLFLPKGESSWACGRFLGLDREGDGLLEGFFHPGTSGSPVLNGAGELVGVAYQTAKWLDEVQYPEKPDGPGDFLATVGQLQTLDRRDRYPSALAFLPYGPWVRR